MQKAITVLLLFYCLRSQAQNIGIGTNAPDSSALLDIKSTTKGFLIPRMTTVQRNAIASPVIGLQVFNLDDQCTDIYDGANWIKNCGLKLISTNTIPGHPTPNSWTQKANFGGITRDKAVGFSIGSKGYIGTGNGKIGSGNDGSNKNDFWEYDPATGSWTQKANFGGTARRYAVGFTLGNKGYIGTGEIAGNAQNDFWEYDPATNGWTQKANFGGAARYSAVGFSIGSKGYVGTGNNGSILNDFWEYDPASNTWTVKASFGGTARQNAVGFSIGSKGYIGTGNDGSYKNDFWEYDPATNAWLKMADFAGESRERAVGFSIGSKGYIGTGNRGVYKKDFWEYDPATNAWIKKADFGGTSRFSAVGFAIGNRGFLGTGSTTNSFYSNDFWEYLDDNLSRTYNASTISSEFNIITDGAWTLANGTVYNANSGNVGIGTANPVNKLSITGNADISGNVGIGTVNAANKLSIKGNADISGNVGIGTLTPSARLDLNGSFKMTDGSQGAGKVLTSDANGLAAWASLPGVTVNPGTAAGNTPFWNGTTWVTNSNNIFNNGGNVGIGTAAPSHKLHIVSNVASALRIDALKAGTDALSIGGTGKFVIDAPNIFGGRFIVNEDGNIGIGTASPSYMLHIVNNGWTPALRIEGSANLDALSIGIGKFSIDRFDDATRSLVKSGRFVINDDGRVGIGTTTPKDLLDVDGKMSAKAFLCRQGDLGDNSSKNYFNFFWKDLSLQCWVDNVFVGTVSGLSDRRLKDNITSMPNTGLAKLMQLKPVTFRYKNIPGTMFTGSQVLQEGFVADELQQIIPSAVNGEKDAVTETGNIQPQSLNPLPIVAILTKSVQEQQSQIEALIKQNALLMKRLEALEKK